MAIGRSAYDRFRGRLLWPIRDAPGDTIGFGARRIFDDDRIEAKYLNTPETRIYKKSQVLYGIDLARREIAKSSQAVIVEGYTDVMACHLAGVGTAVATCGTAFGDDHARVLRRFLNDHEEFRGEVIFTFDGDAAGQKAAIRAFGGDQNFVSQTYVAVEPDGLDPCDVRIKKGDAAVRELVARRVPLYRFVLANIVGKYDLDRADGRVDALRESARLVSSIRDRSKVDAFAREIAGMIGVDVDEARAEVRRAASRQARDARGAARRDRRGRRRRPARNVPDLRDPRFAIERETLKLVVQHPMTIGRIDDRDRAERLHPPDATARSGSWSRPPAARSPASATPAGPPSCATPPPTRPSRRRSARSAVEPLKKEPDAAYVAAARRPADGADRRPADRRDQVQAAAHQPGRARRRVQQDVRRARRPRGAPPGAARPAGRTAPVSRCSGAERPPIRVERGERLLADAVAEEGHLGGTRDALYVLRRRGDRRPRARGDRPDPVGGGPGRRLGPGLLDAAGHRGRVLGRGAARAPASRSRSPGCCSQLVRERVTASVVLQRHVPVAGRRGVRVIARRAPQRRPPGGLALRVRRGRRPRRPGRPAAPPRRPWRPPSRGRRALNASELATSIFHSRDADC